MTPPETRPDTRSALIAAAARLLDEGGPAAVTLREVGRLAGVSHNAPYRHFGDKEELLAAVAEGELAAQAAAPGEAAGPAIEALRSGMHGYVRWAMAYPERFKLTFGPWRADNPGLGEAATAARQGLIATVARAQAEGALPPGEPERLAYLFLALAHGGADLALGGHLSAEGKGKATPEDLVDDLIGWLRRDAPVRR